MPGLPANIYEENRQALFTLALSITGCKSSAEDCVQQAFAQLYLKKLRLTRDPVAYVYRCVRNAAVDARRKNATDKRIRESVFNGFVPPRQNSLDNPDDSVLTAERDQVIRQAIDQLPDSARQIVLLKTFSDLTFKQIGKVLEIPEKTAASQYRRALVKLKEKLKGER